MQTIQLPTRRTRKQMFIEALDRLDLGGYLVIREKERNQWSYYASVYFNSKGKKTFLSTNDPEKFYKLKNMKATHIEGSAIIWRTS